jgi:low temperature requirement protein LtrA
MPGETVRGFKDWFWRPPRPHGATIRDRVVTNLELFYDLVYVAVIGQAASHLADDVSVAAVVGFAIVFAMIWFAWMNGSLYLDLHGRQDGRTRTFVFLQMGILVVLAAFTADATGEEGGRFAVVYALLFAVMGWLWYSVRGRDEARYRTLTGVYVVGMVVSVAVALASALVSPDARLAIWAAFVIAWLIAYVVFGRTREWEIALAPSHSMVERFGLFTIIVLGEVIIGVVDGLSHGEQDALTIATALLGLFVAFGFWWSYFDIVGRRLPRPTGPAIVAWLLGHLPITMAIAAAGAAMTSLVAHAHDPSAPAQTAWLLAGAVAVGLVGLVPTALSLEDAVRLPEVYRKIATTLIAAAVAALVVGWLQLAPWALAALLSLVLGLVWAVTIGRFLRAHAWSEIEAEDEMDAEIDAEAGRRAPDLAGS